MSAQLPSDESGSVRFERFRSIASWFIASVVVLAVTVAVFYLASLPSVGYVAWLAVTPFAGVALTVGALVVGVSSKPLRPRERFVATLAFALSFLTPAAAIGGVAYQGQRDLILAREAKAFCDGLSVGLERYHAKLGDYPSALDLQTAGVIVPEFLRDQVDWYQPFEGHFTFEVCSPAFLALRIEFFDSRQGEWLDSFDHPDEYTAFEAARRATR